MSQPRFAPLPPIIAEMVPPNGIDGERATAVGQTPDGHILYERKWLKQENVPLLDPDGNEVWARHPTTGEKTYPKRRVQTTYYTQRFWLHDDKKGQLWIREFTPPDPVEVKRLADEKAAEQLQRDLAAAMVAEGLTAADLLAGLKAKAPAKVAPPPKPAEPEFPKRAIGGWLLSDGTKVTGKKADAVLAEAALHSGPEF